LVLRRPWRKPLLASVLLASACLASGWVYYQSRIRSQLADVPLEFADQDRISFLAVGRQGYGNRWAAEIAASMGRVATEHGAHFVVLTGDNFYPTGVTSVADTQWQDKFERLYREESLSALPFFAVMGNHDHAGNAEAQLAYARERRGSGRWRMPALQYHYDFGRVDNRVLLRMVFLDTVRMARSGWRMHTAEWFLREAMRLDGDPIWRVVVGHAGVRSRSQLPSSRKLLLADLESLIRELDVDLVLSGNDRFQQLLDAPGGPLHVSTNGGGDKLEQGMPEQSTVGTFIAVRPGFVGVTVDRDSLEVAMMDRHGNATYRKARTR
jgi:tartrate-resistant acid phosphatase type 5